MTDEATKHHRLRLAATPFVAGIAGGARTVAVFGGRPSAGATTVAVCLSQALAEDALRVVLIDADLGHAAVANRCGSMDQPNISDVLSGRKSIHEALQRAPAGMQILAGNTSSHTVAEISPKALQRLRRQFLSLQRHADWIIVDAGAKPTELSSQCWSLAEQVLLITAPDAVAVMDTYAQVKTLHSRQTAAASLSLLVNRAESAAEAADVFRRIDQSCQRFLGIALQFAGFIPQGLSSVNGPPLPTAVGSVQMREFAEAISKVARHITAALPAQATSRRMAA